MPNPNYCHTITLYHCLPAKHSDVKQDVWYRTVLHGCFYKANTTQLQTDTNASMANTYTVRIPADARYVRAAEWISLSDNKKRQRFAVSEGDIVIYGNCTEEITGSGENTAVRLMQRHKPDAFMITSFADNTAHRMGKHYRLGG